MRLELTHGEEVLLTLFAEGAKPAQDPVELFAELLLRIYAAAKPIIARLAAHEPPILTTMYDANDPDPAEERDRLKAALQMLAQTRHVSGSAQGVFRSHLMLVDAVLAGADVRDLAAVEAIAAGTWQAKTTKENQ